MKILDRYILTSFIKTFASVFVILFFIFVLQGIWLFIAELAGKDLDTWVVIKFLLFYSPKIVPLVLPLSILLASIMTFGSFAENYEFAAMKSAGISLNRAMKGLTIFIIALSIISFFFANNIIPKAEYKFLNLRKNIIQRKPAMAIVEGQFNAIGNFNIKVDGKSGENGEKLTGVTIHKRNPGDADAVIIRAKRGLLKSSEKSNLLQLELFDGHYYEDIRSKNPAERQKQPFAKSSFSKQRMNIDLTFLNSSDDMEKEQISQTNNMLTISELNYTLDSLQANYDKEARNVTDNLNQRPALIFRPNERLQHARIQADTAARPAIRDSMPKNLLDLADKQVKLRVLDMAVNSANNSEFMIRSSNAELLNKIKNINGHWLALYEKFVIAFSCLLMFFIGAPLGAIIRKGGLGLPIVFAVLIFIVFHFINTFGRKLAQENGIPPFFGSWMSSFVLSPLAVLLTYRATNDMGVSINFDWLITPFEKLFAKDNTEVQHIVNLDRTQIVEDEEWEQLQPYPNEQLIAIVKNAEQYRYSKNLRNKALQTLANRGITQNSLLEQGNLYDLGYRKMERYYDRYKVYAKTALIAYAAGAILLFLALTRGAFGYILTAFLGLAIFYMTLYRSQRNLYKIGKRLKKNIGPGTVITLLVGFPFYIFVFYYIKTALKKILAQHNYKFDS